MRKDGLFTVKQNRQIAQSVYEMVLEGDTSAVSAPGQFVNVEIEGLFLRRPISVCDLEGSLLTLIYKVVGVGTQKLAEAGPGDRFSLLTGLGNGYDLEKCGQKPLLIGGGVGVPPMYYLAKCLIREGKKPCIVLGFNTEQDCFYAEQFRALGCETAIATADGSVGVKGFVTDAIRQSNFDYDYFCACGPEPMLRAVADCCGCGGQLSFEERMACGFGACMGCSCKTKYGNKRICKDGPVLFKEEVIW